MAYEVHLEVFEGPLDLLLFLIKKNDLDIYNIPIARITQEYLSYLDMMKDLNLDAAGEFLVLASTLMAIKARSLLPKVEEVEVQEGPDPKDELVAKLLEYQKFKEAAKFLEDRGRQFEGVYYRGAPHFEESEKSLSIGMFDLLSALKDVLSRAEESHREVLGEEFPIEEKIRKIVALFSERSVVSWEDVFAGERKRLGILSCFLALLELVKLQKVSIRQDENFGRIMIYKKETPAEQAPQHSDPDGAAGVFGGEGSQQGGI